MTDDLMLPGFYNMDCMSAMQTFPDKFFDLAIVDPPYGGVTQGGYTSNRISGGLAKHPKYHLALWSMKRPEKEYFQELFRVSKNQIVWGFNYFTDYLPPSQCFIVWDKLKPTNIYYADCELAWTSFDAAARIFRYQWNGMLQGDMKNKEQKIHPTQKPVKLYEWILRNYAKAGDKILDTHVGSASSLIACHKGGYKYWGFEIDTEYYRLAGERLDREIAQVRMDLGG